jgi:hypothetical protein
LRSGKLGLRRAAAVEIIKPGGNAEADESLTLVGEALRVLAGRGEVNGGSVAGHARVVYGTRGLSSRGDGGGVRLPCRGMSLLGAGPVGERSRQLGMILAGAFQRTPVRGGSALLPSLGVGGLGLAAPVTRRLGLLRGRPLPRVQLGQTLRNSQRREPGPLIAQPGDDPVRADDGIRCGDQFRELLGNALGKRAQCRDPCLSLSDRFLGRVGIPGELAGQYLNSLAA